MDRDARSRVEMMEARLWTQSCARPHDQGLTTLHASVFEVAKSVQPKGERANIENLSTTIENVAQNVEKMKAQGKYAVIILLPRGLVTIYMNKQEMIVYENYVAMIKSVVPDFDEVDDLGWQLWTTIRNGAIRIP